MVWNICKFDLNECFSHKGCRPKLYSLSFLWVWLTYCIKYSQHSTLWCSSALVVVWLQVQASLYVCDFTDPVPQFSDTRVDARIVPPSAAFSPAHYSSLEPFANIGTTCKRAAGVSLWKPKETNFYTSFHIFQNSPKCMKDTYVTKHIW